MNAMPRANEPCTREPQPALATPARRVNATRVIVATLGLLLSIGGLDHGLFEILQGNAPTPGLFIHSIGPHQQMWLYGTEDAFALIPNYLLSGLASIALSVAIAAWCLGFVHRRHGSAVFLLLSVALFLSGGGVAQIAFFVFAWSISLCINKPPTWPHRLVPSRAQATFGKLWSTCLGIFSLLALAALEIAIAGKVPGVHDPNRAQHICWSLLVAGLGILMVAVASGFVHDAGVQQPS